MKEKNKNHPEVTTINILVCVFSKRGLSSTPHLVVHLYLFRCTDGSLNLSVPPTCSRKSDLFLAWPSIMIFIRSPWLWGASCMFALLPIRPFVPLALKSAALGPSFCATDHCCAAAEQLWTTLTSSELLAFPQYVDHGYRGAVEYYLWYIM